MNTNLIAADTALFATTQIVSAISVSPPTDCAAALVNLATRERFELPVSGLESLVLPLTPTSLNLEYREGIKPPNIGFAIRCIITLPTVHIYYSTFGAGDEDRTRRALSVCLEGRFLTVEETPAYNLEGLQGFKPWITDSKSAVFSTTP